MVHFFFFVKMPTKIPLSLIFIVYSVKQEATKVSPEGNT